MNPISALLAALAALTGAYIVGWARAVAQVRREAAPAGPATDVRPPNGVQIGVGAVTNFFDTLGIGSYATTTALFRALRLVPDRVIPGTLNSGHTLPTVVQAFIYTSIIPVDVLTLISMIAAAVLGAWLGAGVVARWPKHKVQIGMACALIAAALLMLAKQYGWPSPPSGNPAIGVRGILLAVAVAGNFALGALMTLGIGLYAPCMILVSFLGMSEKAAFPIMMGSCAFLMPVGSLRFIHERAYSARAAFGLALGGVPAVIIAAKLVGSLNLHTVRWLVIVVVIYTAITMLYTALSRTGAQSQAALEAEA